MSNYERDIRELKKSLRILSKYIDLCKSGDYDFAVDIPTQIYKSFFDRNTRNKKQTLFERVCFKNNIVAKFHPLLAVYVAIVMPDKSPAYSINGRGLIFDIDREPINFSEWQDQIVQVVSFVDKIEELKTLSLPEVIPRNKINYYLQKQTTALFDWFTIIQADILAQRGYNIKLTAQQQNQKQQMTDTVQEVKIVKLSIEGLFTTIRHKDSAHSDPLDDLRYRNEHDKLYAAKAITVFENDTETTYEQLIVDVAEYMVNRSHEELSEVFARIE